MLTYKGNRYRRAAEEDAAEQQLEPQGVSKKFQLSDGQIDVLSQTVMLGIAVLLKQSGIATTTDAKAFDFSSLLQQIPQLLQKVATDRNTLQKEVSSIIRYGPDKYIARYSQLLRGL